MILFSENIYYMVKNVDADLAEKLMWYVTIYPFILGQYSFNGQFPHSALYS